MNRIIGWDFYWSVLRSAAVCSWLLMLGIVQLESPQQACAAELLFDYSLDSEGFFDDPQRRAVLEVAGSYFERLRDRLTAIDPSAAEGGSLNHFDVALEHPGTGQQEELSDYVVPADKIVIFVGGRDLPLGTLGYGGPGGFSARGTTAFLEIASNRGQGPTAGADAVDFAPWGGTITFDIYANWSVDLQTVGFNKNDLFTVILHEIGHVLGFGTSEVWQNRIDASNHLFLGTASQRLYGGPVPLHTDNSHWAEGTFGLVGELRREAAMDPRIYRSRRDFFTDLDVAGLVDMGWEWAADGDSDKDGDVDSIDLGILLGGWTGRRDLYQGGATFRDGDYDFDGDVDSVDLQLLIAGWTGVISGPPADGVQQLAGPADATLLNEVARNHQALLSATPVNSAAAVSAVPEPASLQLVLVALLATAGHVARYRRRRPRKCS